MQSKWTQQYGSFTFEMCFVSLRSVCAYVAAATASPTVRVNCIFCSIRSYLSELFDTIDSIPIRIRFVESPRPTENVDDDVYLTFQPSDMSRRRQIQKTERFSNRNVVRHNKK